uniref:WD repeat-containing protein 46 n=1 Tax=Lygus hesperus TaxID=30085 RepID=A0A0A9XKT1_LYGHE
MGLHKKNGPKSDKKRKFNKNGPKGGKEKHSSKVEQQRKPAPAEVEDRWKKVPRRRGKPMFKLPSVPKELAEKHTRGDGISDEHANKLVSKTYKKKTLVREQKVKWAEEVAARAELLLTEEPGFLQANEGEVTKKLTQSQIAAHVDITSATKYFELDLDFGPYRIDYTRNGRHLLIGGRRGHVGAFDWVTKRLHCEINVMEEIKDVQWLHIETMFAVAQKNWVHIYNNQGVEIHCLQNLKNVLRMTFLPYHFLLATSNEESEISWLDVSIGEMVATTNVKKGRLGVMAHNPYNGVLCLGHQNGTVSMWCPTKKKPLVKMLCHKAGVETLAIDHSGTYMATTSIGRELKIWDIRKLEDSPVQVYDLRGTPVDTSFSQRGGLALGFNNCVEVYRDWNILRKKRAYLVHESLGMIENVKFCPYEDVLGIGTRTGFTSIIVPGSGEPNFDALEANPMQTKSQRREAEVKSLLDKVQPEMIVLEPRELLNVNVPKLKERIQTKIDILKIRPPEVEFTPRNKKRGNTARKARVKKIVKQDMKKDMARKIAAAQNQILEEAGVEQPQIDKQHPSGALSRFLPKNRKK